MALCSRRSSGTLAGMGSEIAPVLLGPVLVVCALSLVYLAISGRHRPVGVKSTLGLGRRRLARGYLAVIAACLAYAYWDTIQLSQMKVTRGDVSQAEASKYFWGWFVYGFTLSAPFNLFFLTALGLPALSLLRRFGFMSVVGACIASQVIALMLVSLLILLFENDWCRAHAAQCIARDYGAIGVLALLMALAFSLASRLPWLKWVEHAS